MKAAHQFDVGGTMVIRRRALVSVGTDDHTLDTSDHTPLKLQEFSAVVFALADDCFRANDIRRGKEKVQSPI
jgi:hypothetical protein